FADVRPATVVGLDDPRDLQPAQRFTQRGAAHLELLCQVALSREPVARAVVSLPDQLAELSGDLLGKSARPANRLDHGGRLQIAHPVDQRGLLVIPLGDRASIELTSFPVNRTWDESKGMAGRPSSTGKRRQAGYPPQRRGQPAAS